MRFFRVFSICVFCTPLQRKVHLNMQRIYWNPHIFNRIRYTGHSASSPNSPILLREVEEEDDFREYGVSKEHRPNPIDQMGLFMDGSGLPLAFSMTPGNSNEQSTLKPLEKRILKDFNLSKFVVCMDAGLSSNKNRLYNTHGERAFVTTQSIKKLKKFLKEWALDPKGWRLSGSHLTG